MLADRSKIPSALLDPLSRALAPLMDGLLRHALFRLGIEERQAWVNGVSLNYYYRPAAQSPRKSWRRRILSGARRIVLRQRPAQRPTPIVLIHGLGDNALTWTLVLELLAPGRDIYALDLPGYGNSGLPPGQHTATFDDMRDALTNFLCSVVGRPALVVGNSMGAWLATRLAEAIPEMVREVVLINAGGAMLEGRPSWEPFRDNVAMADLKTTRLVIRQVLGFFPAILIYAGQRSIQERFQRQVVRAFVEMADERDFLAPEELQELSVPASIIWGLDDRFLPAGSLEFFQKHLPNAQTLLVHHCGHLPQRERPLLVARFLDERAGCIDQT
jgi:pimeloyl-ACP methyl ester carboxylesterase